MKIDLIVGNSALAGYGDSQYNSLRAFRKLIRIAREAAGEDVYILACSSPLHAACSHADGVRTGMDIFERYDSLKNVARHVANRLYISRFLNIDPDCIMLRDGTKEDGECFRPCTRTEDEIDTFLALLRVAGGAVFVSDKLSLLDRADFDKIRALFPLRQSPATPLDMFESEIPFLYDCGAQNGMHEYAMINWSDLPKKFSLSVGEATYRKTVRSHCSEILRFDGKNSTGE